MECPYCGKELEYHDYFGLLAAHQSGKKYGNIYQCNNEDCESYQQTFYTYCNKEEDLIEGYPC